MSQPDHLSARQLHERLEIDGKVVVNSQSRVLGARTIEVHLERGVLTHVAMNGAAAIHDVDLDASLAHLRGELLQAGHRLVAPPQYAVHVHDEVADG